MRIAAILFLLGGAAGIYGASQFQVPAGAVEIFPGATLAGGVIGLVFGALGVWIIRTHKEEEA